MAITAETPTIPVKCDHDGCDLPAIAQIGVGFVCIQHAIILSQTLINLCNKYWVEKLHKTL